MNDVYIAVTGVTILANGAVAAGGLAKAPAWVPLLGGLKAAGAIGLLAGVLGVPVVGTAAAAGLVSFFTAAICFHIRAHVFYSIAFPGFFLALAAASLALSLH